MLSSFRRKIAQKESQTLWNGLLVGLNPGWNPG